MSKFQPNDRITVQGRAGKVLKAHPLDLFGNEIMEYVIIFDDSSIEFLMPESALTLDTPKAHGRLCECGAWAIHWAPESHSGWCPAHRTYSQGSDDNA